VTTVPEFGGSPGRVHIVFVPGFGAFDALGQIEYYAGTTDRYKRWLENGGSPDRAVVLEYFDNLPTAGVSTRAAWLHSYLAKRIARGEIGEHDAIALVGHSTGGLDIRRMLFSPAQPPPDLVLDGGAAKDGMKATAVRVKHQDILKKVSRLVFISVPQYGTNIASWVRGHALLRRAVIEGLYRGVQGASIPPLGKGISLSLDAVAKLTKQPGMLEAAEDALNETNTSRTDTPSQLADAEQAGAQLRLWLQYMDHDFGVIDDLASFTDPPPSSTSPAHYCDLDREAEQALWRDHHIKTRSIATIGRRAFTFDPRTEAKPFVFHNPCTWPTTNRVSDAGEMDSSYLLTYRACAGGPFEVPASVAGPAANIDTLDQPLLDVAKLGPCGPTSGQGLAVWDNDGIVNTASMLWPDLDQTRLVAADHLDIVGHYVLRAVPSRDVSGRRYASVDALKSHTEFTHAAFDRVWKDVFDFCVS
jgi:triacylglycerol lipase